MFRGHQSPHSLELALYSESFVTFTFDKIDQVIITHGRVEWPFFLLQISLPIGRKRSSPVFGLAFKFNPRKRNPLSEYVYIFIRGAVSHLKINPIRLRIFHIL